MTSLASTLVQFKIKKLQQNPYNNHLCHDTNDPMKSGVTQPFEKK
jgi:hypothetical protein